MKPILFNTGMVKAILEGRKTVTRRVIKHKYSNTHFRFKEDKYGITFIEIQDDVEGETFGKNKDGSTWHKLLGYIEPKPPYQKGDVLYVRETYRYVSVGEVDYEGECIWEKDEIEYKASQEEFEQKYEDYIGEYYNWRPSIHMPKSAARIFLRVADVRVERLQDIDKNWSNYDKEGMRNPETENISIAMQERFISIWNSTIPKKDPGDMYQYGWKANPYVWVIEFEVISKEKAYENQ